MASAHLMLRSSQQIIMANGRGHLQCKAKRSREASILCVEKFVAGLKPAAKKYARDTAPAGWWTETESLFDKAL